jgi:3-hydroxymyristoyl/3-hydroxydecanoyl-(acyl carrier protein) dehydratase
LIDGEIIVSGRTAVGRKLVSGTEPFASGHYPGNPLFPGMLSLECLSEVAEALGRRLSGNPDCATSEIKLLRFIETILPGDVLSVEVSVAETHDGGYLVDGRINAGGRLKAKGALLVSWPTAQSIDHVMDAQER